MKQPLLQITHLSAGYKRGVDILHDICMTVSEGEAIGIIGLNGSGKSTLGRSIMNSLPFCSGDIDFMGELINKQKTHEISRKGIARMVQGGSVFGSMTVRDNISLAFERSNDNAFTRQLFAMIPLLSDTKKSHLMADRLSGGERQALSLAMTLACNPKLVILDEPSAGLSPADTSSIFCLLETIRESFGTTIMLIEQNITRAVEFCDRSLLLESGRIISEQRGKNIQEIEKQLF